MTLFNELTRMLNPHISYRGFSKIHEFIEFEGATFSVEASFYGFDRQFCPIEFEMQSIYIDEHDWHDNLSKLAREQIQQKVIDKITFEAIDNARRNKD